MWFDQRPPRFACQACGLCCLGDGGDYVALIDDEASILAAHLGLSIDELQVRYLDRLGSQAWGVRIQADKRCIFLDADKRCAVYAVRPQQCQSYPYWPEIVVSERRFTEERQRCQGIGQGEPVSPAQIRDWLAKDPGSLE